MLPNDRIVQLMRTLVHHDPMLDSVAVAEVDLTTAEQAVLAAKVSNGRAVQLLPGIYSVTNPAGAMFGDAFGNQMPPPSVPAPHLVAAALASQHRWQLALPVPFSQFLLGLADRPDVIGVIPYDQPHRSVYEELGLTMEPAPASLFRLTASGQALTQGLPKEASEIGLLRIALEAAQGLLGEAEFRLELQADIAAGRLGEREYMVARAIVTADTGPKPLRRAPPTFEPPIGDVVRLDGWVRAVERDGSEYLVARHVTGHPYAGQGGRGMRTSPLVWIDEALGWAKTRSRLKVVLTH